MRKFLLSLALVLLASPALAQNVTCPDRPHGDSTNACANTRFVQQNAGGGGGGSPGGLDGQIQYNNTGAFGGFTANGDATINTGTGQVTVSKSNGVAFGTAAFQNMGSSMTQAVLNYACSTASNILWNSAGTWVCNSLGQLAINMGIPVPMKLYSTGGTSNDTAGVQAALTACTGTGCVLYCESKTIYTVDILVVGSSTTVTNCNFKQRVQGNQILVGTSVTNVKIIGNTFTGNTALTGVAAPISGDTPVWFTNSTYIWVENNYSTKFGLYDVYIKNSNRVFINGNATYGVAFGPRLLCTSMFKITGNTYELTSLFSTTPTANQFAIGPTLDSDVCGPSTYGTIANNLVKDFPYSQAYEIHAGQFISVANNVAVNVSMCISVNSFAAYDSISRIAIVGNVCQASSITSIPTESNIGISLSGGASLPKPTSITIANNTLEGFNSIYKSLTGSCIQIDWGDYISVTGNVLSSCRANGIGVFNTQNGFVASGNSINNIVAVSGTQNGILLHSTVSGGGYISGNIVDVANTNISGAPAGFTFAGLNGCQSVTTCN